MYKVIGEGTYGCVHKPSLRCNKTKKIDYKTHVSKLMERKSAKQELSEFLLISKLDPKNEFHLGTPTMCRPDIQDPAILKGVEKCQRIKAIDVVKTPDDYRLLILKDGGYDLSYFCKNFLTTYIRENPLNIDIFWLEIHHLLKGLDFFAKNDIVHHDLKPQNIVFNPMTYKFMYIDFGLMQRKSKMIKRSVENDNSLAVFHWSYPIDTGFLNKMTFDFYDRLSNIYKQRLKNQFQMEVIGKKVNEKLMLSGMQQLEAFQIFFSYIYIENTKTKMLDDIGIFFNSYEEYVNTHTYRNTIEKTVNTFDIYGLGFTLKYTLNQFWIKKALSPEFYKKASQLFEQMYSFDFSRRIDSSEEILYRYEQILIETNLLLRLNKRIVDHNVVDSMTINLTLTDPSINNNNRTIDLVSTLTEPSVNNRNTNNILTKTLSLTPEMEEFAYEDPVKITMNCKDKTEYNPLRKRCVKKCKEGKMRNSMFRCITSKTKTKAKMKTRKICLGMKELNPATNRCVKQCKEGQHRNSAFKCVKK